MGTAAGVDRVHRIAWRCAPLIVFGLVPPMFQWRLWIDRELTFLAMATLIVLGLQPLVRVALSTPPVWMPTLGERLRRRRLIARLEPTLGARPARVAVGDPVRDGRVRDVLRVQDGARPPGSVHDEPRSRPGREPDLERAAPGAAVEVVPARRPDRHPLRLPLHAHRVRDRLAVRALPARRDAARAAGDSDGAGRAAAVPVCPAARRARGGRVDRGRLPLLSAPARLGPLRLSLPAARAVLPVDDALRAGHAPEHPGGDLPSSSRWRCGRMSRRGSPSSVACCC